MIKNIRHIIFDLGGVLLNIDYLLTEQAFVALGFDDFAARYSQLQQTSLFDDFEKGVITQEAFIDAIKSMMPQSINDAQITAAWNAMLLDFPLRRLQILQQLQLHYNLFLLSNTNEIHEAKFNELLKQQTGFPGLGVFFDKVYYSHRIGMRKPDKAIFKFILQQHDLDAAQTLFIDDSPQHIEAARDLGIQTVWLQKGMTIEDDIFKPKQ